MTTEENMKKPTQEETISLEKLLEAWVIAKEQSKITHDSMPELILFKAIQEAIK